MDDSGTPDAAGSWLTYAELATLRGITRKAAIRLTQRHQWRRQPGNDGATRVLVPADVASRQPSRDGGTPDPTPHLAPDFPAQALAALEATLTALREAHAGELRSLREQLDGARTALATARTEATDAVARAAAAEQATRVAQGATEALRQAEAARKARGRWARLRAAWRERSE